MEHSERECFQKPALTYYKNQIPPPILHWWSCERCSMVEMGSTARNAGLIILVLKNLHGVSSVEPSLPIDCTNALVYTRTA